MTRGRWVKVAAVGLVLLLVYAWIDGGREPPHRIHEPIAIPGGAR